MEKSNQNEDEKKIDILSIPKKKLKLPEKEENGIKQPIKTSRYSFRDRKKIMPDPSYSVSELYGEDDFDDDDDYFSSSRKRKKRKKSSSRKKKYQRKVNFF